MPRCSHVEIFKWQVQCHPFFSPPYSDISEDLGVITLTKGFLLHLSGRDTSELQLGKPISQGVLFYSQGTSCWWSTLTLWTIVCVKAVTPHKWPDRTLPPLRCPLVLTAAHIAVVSTSNRLLTFCTLNDLGQPDHKAKTTSNLAVHFKEAAVVA